MLTAIGKRDLKTFADFNIPADIEGDLKPVILDRKVPALYQNCYKGAIRTL
jgi:hypothetical protein